MVLLWMQEALLLDMARAAAEKLQASQEKLSGREQQQQKDGQPRQHRLGKGILPIFEGMSEGILVGICHDAATGYFSFISSTNAGFY